MNKKIFLSAVSSEFESYRKLLAQDLKRPTLDVAVQEDFGVTDGTTLQKLDVYIRACDGIVHVLGKGTGAVPELVAVQKLLAAYPDFVDKVPVLASLLTPLLPISNTASNHTAVPLSDPGISYTQWEAWLAIYHRRPLFVYRPTDFDLAVCQCPRETRFIYDPEQEQFQKDHYRRICDMGHDRGQFLNQERLSSAVLRDLVEILPRLESRIEVPPSKLRHTAEKLVGREMELTLLDDAWNNSHINLVVIRGKGGEGKTSLVASWMAELAFKDWRGAERVLDWSFYSQGTREQSSATSEFFFNHMLRELGDPDPSAGSPDDRAARLVRLLNQQRTLLVLDGLEPLQYPPGPMHGGLKDGGMAALLRGLAAKNQGLVIVTTRERVGEVEQHYGRSAHDHELQFLSPLAGAQVLHNAGARRAGQAQIAADDIELQNASREVDGHALTLFLVGRFLGRFENDGIINNGDIRRRDVIGLAEVEHDYKNDPKRPYGHAFKAIEAYEKWFAEGDESAQRQLSILRMLGLFDRPAPTACLQVLRAELIVGLSDVWKNRSDREWNGALSGLEEIGLIDVEQDGTAIAVDCHPLIREYFAEQLRKVGASSGSTESDAHRLEAYATPFQIAHSRLFDHLCESTEHWPDTLDGLQPLYQAVVHGCLAGRQPEAREKVYRDRILRGTGHDGFYSQRKLGAIGADLGAVAAFFTQPWIRLSPNLSEQDQAWLLAVAAFNLRALGRLTEALEPMRVGVQMAVIATDTSTGKARIHQLVEAARRSNNLSELEVTLGRLKEAVVDARRAIEFADRSGEWDMRMIMRTIAADALHQLGSLKSEVGSLKVGDAGGVDAVTEARQLFDQAEALQRENQPKFDLLYSLQGFRYCDLILAPAERAAWHSQPLEASNLKSEISAALVEAERRVAQTLKWMIDNRMSLLSIALDHLTLARVALYRAALSAQSPGTAANPHLAPALEGLKASNNLDELPKALLTAAHWHALIGDADTAHRHLDEAQQIAERGPMPLFLADVHLHRARIFGSLNREQRNENYPGIDPHAELAAAKSLIQKHHYGRRSQELADAEAAAVHW